MQTIEIYTPNRDADGNFLGLNHEAIFYDAQALVEPVRIVRNFAKLCDFDEGDPYVFIECVQTIFPVRVPRPLTPGTVSSTKCLTCTAGLGPRSGNATWSRRWRSPRTDDIFSFE